MCNNMSAKNNFFCRPPCQPPWPCRWPCRAPCRSPFATTCHTPSCQPPNWSIPCILSLECLAQKLDCCNFTQKVKSMTDGWTWVGARDTFVSKNLLATDPDLIWSHHEAIKRDQNTKAIWLFKLLSVLNHKLQLWQIRKSRPRLPVGGPGSVCECHRVLCLPHQIDQSN